MQKIFYASEKLFFSILIICLISSVYFNVLPMNNTTLMIGFILSGFYFGVNFYVGYKYELTLKEGLIVAALGCSLGLFLGFFSLYSLIFMNDNSIALSLINPYYSPTTSIIKFFIGDINIMYPFILMIINIILVIIGSFSKKLMNKLLGE